MLIIQKSTKLIFLMQENRRLYIEKIAVENFKSYKGKHSIGEFSRGFNSVVGPNGSGKSNIIDAILFVLGFRAKRLRHSRIEDLINSSDPDTPSGSVTIHFTTVETPGEEEREEEAHSGKQSTKTEKEKDSGAEIDVAGRFSVSRSVNRKGKSTYYINNTVVTTEQVSGLLIRHNVDLVNNRFMILQGEIENISNMKPKGASEPGFVEYLEEIIGTHAYVEEIEEESKRAEAAVERIERARAEYVFVEKEAEYLKAKSEAAEKSIARCIDLMERRKVLEEREKEALEHRTEEEEKKLAEIEQKQKARSAEIERFLKIAKDKEDALETEKNRARKEEALYLESKKRFEEKDMQYRRNRDLEKIYDEKLRTLKTELEEKRAAKTAHAKAQKECKEEIAQNTAQISEETKAKQEMQREIEETEKSLKNTHLEELKRVEEKIEAVAENRKKHRDKERKTKREIEESSKEVKRAEDIVRNTPKEIEQIKESVKQYSEEEYRRQEKKLEEIRHGKEETLRECAKREEILSDLLREESAQSASDRLRELSRIEGYYGRIRDLGTIPEKYSIALSAAGKGALNHLVVDTTRTAEKCLDVIKQKRLGRYTILVLDKIKRAADRKSGKSESNRLVDKIRTDEKYLPCFYHVVGETLVVENIEAAMKRAFAPDRPKVVTLDGKVIDKSGLMSGGRVQHIPLTNKRSGKDMQKEIDSARSSANEAKEGLKMLNSAMEKVEKKFEEMSKKRQEKESAAQKIEQLEKKLQKGAKEMEAHAATKERIEKLKRESRAEEEEIKQIESEEAALVRKKHEIEQKIEKTLGAHYKTLRAKLKGVEESVISLQERNMRLSKRLSEEEPSVEGIEKEIEETEKKRRQIEAVLPQAEEKELVLREKALRDVRIEVEKAAQEKSHADSEIDAQRKDSLEIEKERAKIEDSLLRDRAALEKNKNSAILTRGRLHAVRAKLGEYADTIGESGGGGGRDIGRDNGRVGGKDSDRDNGKDSRDAHAVREILPKAEIIEKSAEETENEIESFLAYQQKKEQLEKERRVLEEKETEERQIRERVTALKDKRCAEFLKGLKEINANLKRIYGVLTFGGDAELEPVDYNDPFSEGVSMSVMPPRKSWKSIAHLSGGERTLSSLSLIFALHEYKPNSFYVMDEVDAALDYKNVGVVGRYVAERTKDCQFIVVSLRENMYELASVFIGVYKHGDTTMSVTVKS